MKFVSVYKLPQQHSQASNEAVKLEISHYYTTMILH